MKRNIFKSKKIKKRIIGALACALIIANVSSVSAAVETKTAKNSRTETSWVGIPVYTIGVKGDYKTNGKKLSGWSNARCNNATHYPGWSCTAKSASWVSKGEKKSTVRNCSTFFYGLDTQWITVGIQSYDDEISKSVTP